MGTWWGEGHGGREAAGLEPRDNLSKPVESKKKIRLKTLALIPTRIERAGAQKERRNCKGGLVGKGQRHVLERIQCHAELDHKK